MKIRAIMLLVLLLLLTACGGEAEPRTVTKETKRMVQTEKVMQTECVPAPTSEPEKPKAFDLDADDSYILMKIAMAEAEGEDTEGKALVILVVLNRVESAVFPDTVEEVVMQENQFSPVSNGRYERVEPDADCRKALEMVMDGTDRRVLYILRARVARHGIRTISAICLGMESIISIQRKKVGKSEAENNH